MIPSLEAGRISSCYAQSDTTILCGKNTIRIAIGADPSTHLVDKIEYYPNISITVEEIIRKYGNPNFAYVTGADIPEEIKVGVILLWDSIKMRIDLSEVEAEFYTVENTTQIQSIIFLDEASYADLTTNMFAQPWRGYDNYQPDLSP